MLLFTKMIRDLGKAKAQFFTIVVIAACGVFAFVGAMTVGNRLDDSVSAFYRESAMNDLWINVNQADEQDIEALMQLPGIDQAQGRTVMKVFSDNRRLDLFVLSDNKLARPHLEQGEPFQDTIDGLWLDHEFAKANALDVGDSLRLHIGDGESVPLIVRGLVVSPEKLIDVSSETLSTRHDLYGYGYVGETAASRHFATNGYNQILLKLTDSGAQAEVASQVEQLLGERFVSSVTHEEHPSAMGAAAQIAQFRTIGLITPLLFFLLAALVVVSTMSRLISGQRIQIGALMSLGVTIRQIRWHYMSYGLLLGGLGGLLGFVAGYYGIPAIFMSTLTSSFILPEWSAAFSPETLWSVAAISACCTFAAFMASKGQLASLPAAVLRGEAPASPKRSRLERLLRRFGSDSFRQLWLLRNIQSHKIRSLMGVVGSFGCAFLILFGFANIDSSNRSLDFEFDEQYRFAYKANLDKLSPEAAARMDWAVDGMQMQVIQESRITIRSQDVEKTLPITIAGEGSFIQLNTEQDRESSFPKTGIVMTSKMAAALGVSSGESVSIRLDGGEWREIQVADTVRLPSADRLFLFEVAWGELGEAFVPNALLLGDDNAVDYARNMYPITQVVAKSEMKEANRALNQGVFASAAGLAIAAILLGIAVIYNLGLINLTEMSRQFATLKVLGLRHREIASLIFQESFLLSTIGIVLALPAGWGAIHALDKVNVSEGIMVIPDIKFTSYLIAVGLTLVCLLFVNIMMSSKLRKIDMVTSLKSVD